MPRRKRSSRVFRYHPLSFKKLCDKAGIKPKQRIIMRRYMNEKLKKEVR